MPFFNLEAAKGLERGDEAVPGKRSYSCEACGLMAKCRTPKIGAIGMGAKKILIIGDAANSEEDKSNNEVHGSRYTFVKRMLKRNGISIEKDCWYTHAIRCYTKDATKDALPATTMSGCHNLLMAEIMTLQPIVIVPISPLAWSQLFYDRDFGRGAEAFYQWAGSQIPDQILGSWVMPVYDPVMVAAEDEKQVNKYALFNDRHWKAISLVEGKPPVLRPEQKCEVTLSEDRAIQWINEAMEWRHCSFDYETTGLKAHRKGMRITHASISDGKISYGFKFHYTPKFLEAWRNLMTSDVSKISHNASFERLWTRINLGYDVANLDNDTQLMWHCLHNRKPTGLKYLTFMHYGVIGYDGPVESYIRATSEEEKLHGANSFNRMAEAPAHKTALYCAMDSLFTFWLYRDLKKQLHPDHHLPGYKFFMIGQEAFDTLHEHGVPLDMELLAETKPMVEAKMAEALRVIEDNKYIMDHWNGHRKFNPSSDADVRRLLYVNLGAPIRQRTDSGEPSVDEDALAHMEDTHPLVRDLIKYRKWRKIHSTYIGQYEREACDGIIHAFFRLTGVATFRSNSGQPNFQNGSKRDKEAKRIVRSMLKPHPGHRIIEYDYKSAEIAIAAAVTGDANLVKYVNDLSTDMHLDAAVDLFMVPKDKVNKLLRNAAKGPFVFASFYGSYWKQTAEGIWNEINIKDAEKVYGFNVVEHLKSCGIRSYTDWEEHVKEQERVLWFERFPAYQQFREDTYDFFCREGYIDYVNGFRYEGPATKNEVLNAPVQGPAFHTQLWAFAQVHREIREKGSAIKLYGNIHDSAIFSCPPDEEAWLDSRVAYWFTVAVKEHYTWIDVLLMVEKERSEVNGNWSEMTNCGFVKP